ncbi:MAG: hypothetical protein AB7N71_11285 [Phycisphaerae bacterium]
MIWKRGSLVVVSALSFTSLSGCGSIIDIIDIIGGGPIGGGFGTPVFVEVFNDSDFEVFPDIRFDSDEFADVFTARDFLDIGELLPGEFVQFEIDCDLIGTIFCDESVIFDFGVFVGLAEVSAAARYDRDFLCGDDIVITFIGSGDFFDVIVEVNGFEVFGG